MGIGPEWLQQFYCTQIPNKLQPLNLKAKLKRNEDVWALLVSHYSKLTWGKKKTVAYKITSIGRDLGYEITKKVQFRLKDKIREYHLSLSPESRQQLHRKLIENGTPCSACPPSSGVNSSGALPMDV